MTPPNSEAIEKCAKMAKNQLLHRGDRVRVAEDLGPYMQHFSGKGEEAVIEYSYHDRYGGANSHHKYCLLFLDGSSSAWYYETQLTPLGENIGELGISEIKNRRRERECEQGSIDWIISNWPNIKEAPPHATLQALANLIGFGDLWGSRGEGIDLAINSLTIHRLFEAVLESGNKETILLFVAKIKQKIRDEKSNSHPTKEEEKSNG